MLDLTVEQMGTILKEATLGLTPTLTSADALKFRQRMVEQVADIRARGLEVDIPND